MLENPRRGRQAINFTTNVPKILVLKSSSEQIFSRKLPLGAPVLKFIPSTKTQRHREPINDGLLAATFPLRLGTHDKKVNIKHDST